MREDQRNRWLIKTFGQKTITVPVFGEQESILVGHCESAGGVCPTPPTRMPTLL